MQDAIQREEGEGREREVEELHPIGSGVFGNIYDQFRGKAKAAIDFLRRLKSGEAIGALHHKDIGDIALVWGNAKAGLQKIMRKHPEVLDNLQETIDGMHIVQTSDNRIKLESDTHFAVVSRDWLGEEHTPWLLTAYEKKESSATNNRMDTADTSKGKRNDTTTPQGTASEDKGSEISPTDQEKSRKVAGSGTPNEAQAAVEAAEAKTDTEPTEAQKEAGNYKKGHVKIDGLDITIENPKGSVRRGTDAGGKQWEQEMRNTYGYILGTEGVDGDHIDVFLSDDPSQGDVFVVDQVNKDGTFDEHKVMYGFPDIESARKAYLSNYEEGWQGLGAVTPVSKEEFKKWIGSSHRKTKPFAEYSIVKPLGGTSESEVAVERAIGTEGDVGILESRGVKLQKEDADAEHSATSKEHALREAMVEQLRAAGIDVITDDAEGQRVLDEANEGTRLMGSRTDRKMREVEKFYKGKELDKNTQAVIDVYSGKADNVAIEVERPEGKCRVIMRQGNENKAGTKHSLFRHLDINSGHVTIDELSIIPKVISDGERTENGKKIAYDFVTEDGTRMRVTTEIAVGREVFTNFLSNRRPLKSESRNNTQLSARATDPEVSDTKVGYNSETAKKKGEKVREQKAGKDTIPSVEDFSKKHGVSQKQVSVYAASMQRGSLAGATRAYMEIRREVISRHPEIRNLRALSKTMKPLREELYSAFGNVDELREEIRRRTDEERNAMEAARKREEEKAADERQRMSELESMSDEELDKEYFKALEANDEARVGELVKAAARRKGYGDTESEYQGVGSWSAPSNPGYETKEERRVEIKNGGTDVNLEDVADGYSPQPDDFFSNLRTYSNDTPHGKESAEAVSNAITALKDGKQATVKVYRAVPSDVKESKMRNGDWVTPSRKYAEMHGDHRLEGKYRIIEQDVPADELWWDGNDINEWGYDDGKSYAYKNTRNNRKSTDAVSYNDNGDVIPLSKRFNDRQDDVRFFRNKDGEVYGFTVGGKIYIDPRKVNAETPLHEYAHLWAEALRKMNPQEWQNVVELMKGTPVWDEVKRKYAELATDGEIADEVIAQYSGRKGAEKMRAEQERAIKEDSDMLDKAAAVAAFERVKKALKGFWKAVADFLHIHYNSAEEVADRVLKDFLDGVNPMSGGKDLASQATGDMNLRFQKEQEKLESESGDIRFREEDIETVNAQFNEGLAGLTEENADKVTLWLGSPSDVLLSAGVEDKAMKLYGNKVIKKMKKHGFALKELRDLPRAVADPIAVFNNYDMDGNRSILTELRTDAGNLLVTIDLGVDQDVDFNIISSVFGKGHDNVVDWFNKGYATYINREKALAFLSYPSAPIAATAAKAELSSAAKIVKDFENPSIPNEKDVKEGVHARDGKGPYPDTEPSEERGRIRRVAEQAAELLHLDNLEILESGDGLEGAKARAKGFYDKKTGKITVIVGNHSSARDMQQTILHEAVAHYGLRKLFGTHFDTFLDNVYEHAEEPIRKKIAEMAARRGWDFRKATEEYLAALAESEEFADEVRNGFFAKVRELFIGLLHKIGFKGFDGVSLGDNELRYMLWRSHENLANPGRFESILGMAEDIEMQSRLGVGNYAEGDAQVEEDVEDVEVVNARFNEELEMYAKGALPVGHRFELGLPSGVLRSAGFENLPISMRSSLLVRKAGDEKHPFEAMDLQDLVKAVQRPIAIFRYSKGNMRNLIVDVKHGDKHFLIGVTLNFEANGIEINSVSGLFPKESHEWVKWIQDGKAMRIDEKEKVLNLIDSLRTNPAESERIGLDLSSAAKIVKDFENPSIPNGKDVKEDVRARDGKGSYPDTEPSEERGRIRLVAEQAAELLHLDNLEILESGEGLEGAKSRAKGFYDKRSGKITVIVGNHSSTRDMQQTILHEAVAHYGLRKLFGTHFELSWTMYRACGTAIRKNMSRQKKVLVFLPLSYPLSSEKRIFVVTKCQEANISTPNYIYYESEHCSACQAST